MCPEGHITPRLRITALERWTNGYSSKKPYNRGMNTGLCMELKGI